MYNNNNNFGGGGYNQGGGYNSGGYNNNGGGYNNNNGGYNNNNNNNGGYNNNRPQQQQQQQQQYVNNNNNSFDNNGYGGDDDVTNNSDYQSTTRNIQQIQNAVQILTKLVQLLGTPKDSMDTREKIRNCVDSTTHLISSESGKVKNLTSLASRSRDSKNKLLYQKLVKEFNNCLQQFKDIAQVATKKEKTTPLPVAPDHQQPTTFGRNNNSNNNNQNNHFLNNQQPYYDDDNREDEHQSLMESSRRQQLAQIEAEREYQNSIIQERDEGIRKIEQSIVEINEIFVDLSGLVAEQGVMINTIEASLESTTINTKEGVNHLREASKNQKSSRNKMCWIVLILLIVCAVLGVILFFTLRK
ncbi:syntaxin 7 [Dictyostelium discoideum AX4]|uniref:Syntaxin-7A n=1 Tax=Dictyostelium discoideum TaxID=44689 RepID=STX7A_DICDI|nr:syntaxin 7 [Dictyostelium discoideum AX4]Q54JY7.1 RecName: Full=Syntaxin-7A [Dictyostelium discoideum]EAL63513.1 syntaxin 7 [Dictyostelium discoideum AX4]|eukprot:XP_637015.1 syntaxin 7 [Dictyostelium discoideum AX4]